MSDKWVDYGLALGDISKFLEYLKLYKASKLGEMFDSPELI